MVPLRHGQQTDPALQIYAPIIHNPFAMSMRDAYIFAMSSDRTENIFGALALALSDEIVRASSMAAPEVGPAAAAIVLLGHEPGMSIAELAVGVALTHPGAVRLVDRLVTDGMIERRADNEDGRVRSLHLTKNGEESCKAILFARGRVVAKVVQALTTDELQQLECLSERMLRSLLIDAGHALRICRLCDYGTCDRCPIDLELGAG